MVLMSCNCMGISAVFQNFCIVPLPLYKFSVSGVFFKTSAFCIDIDLDYPLLCDTWLQVTDLICH